jgi:hypothetical protein
MIAQSAPAVTPSVPPPTPAAGPSEQALRLERQVSDAEAEIRRLRAICQQIVERYDRERATPTWPADAAMLAWAMQSDAKAGL